MTIAVNFAGSSFSVPQYNDTGWATYSGNLTSYLVAIASNTLQPIGGSFFLTAQANFGPYFGIQVLSVTSESSNPAQAGVLQLADTDTVNWRNVTNTGDNALGVNAANQLIFNGTPVGGGGGTALVNSLTVTTSPHAILTTTTYLCQTASIPITLNLPAPAANAWFFVKDISNNAGTNPITIHRYASETIDGNSSDLVLQSNNISALIMSDGTNWWTLGYGIWS
jgi:hypothetical protein